MDLLVHLLSQFFLGKSRFEKQNHEYYEHEVVRDAIS